MHMTLSREHDDVMREGTETPLARILVIEDDDGTAERGEIQTANEVREGSAHTQRADQGLCELT